MLKIRLIIFFIFLSALTLNAQHRFYINLNDRDDDLFKVTLIPDAVTLSNNIFHFASAAPGTYQRMDIGRFVRFFKAFDKNGTEIRTENISVNKWSISSPDKIAKIEYHIAETWDTPVEENKIYEMAGTSIENDHALINGNAVFGYFEGLQSHPINVKIYYPENWLAGTALDLNNEGYYEAESFDHIVDSPILLGRLSKASTDVRGTQVDIYTYSKTDLIKSENILNIVDDILNAAGDFIVEMPVDRYTFLFHFEDFSAGAWEHSYSSGYVYKEAPLEGRFAESLRSTVAHEFFHIITPLNIHSELVADFSFEEPTMSQHIWLYEGVTEWASDIMQLRGDLISLDDYLHEMTQKLIYNDYYGKQVSFTELSRNATKLQRQFYSFYLEGAIAGAILDLKLLKLSGGEKGLREVIIELSKEYGPDKPFSEDNFFKDFAERTYPEIKIFFEKYIDGSEELPIEETFAMIGINYFPQKGTDESRATLGINFTVNEGKLVIMNAESNECGAAAGDILEKVNGNLVSMNNASEILRKLRSMNVGEKIELEILRDGKNILLDCSLKAQPIFHVFELKENPSDEELRLREIWMKNL
jgi:predicted metalloprotease with PDZ domain